MARSERLLDLLHALRNRRRPVSGRDLADDIGVSLRTLYRDIDSLRAMGAGIEGEAGVGYVLRPGFLLPPLMFPIEELEALALGCRWVAKRADDRLSEAAESALSRIQAVLPADLQSEFDATSLLIGPGAAIPTDTVDPALLRRAIRAERKLRLLYRDNAQEETERVVWPFGFAYFDQARLLMGWCELRQDFRSFRADRIAKAELLEERYPKRRQALLKQWREARGYAKI